MNYKFERFMNLLAVNLAIAALGSCASTSGIDAVTKATAAVSPAIDKDFGGASCRVLLILASAPGGSTEKIAGAMARALDARILSPAEAEAAALSPYSIVGFGSGIMDQMHHRDLISFVDALPLQAGRKAFLYSTSGVSRQFALKHHIDDPHALLRRKLEEKGFTVVGEFNCAGFNANSFLKFFGGMNKGKPDREDLARAETFARGLLAEEQAP